MRVNRDGRVQPDELLVLPGHREPAEGNDPEGRLPGGLSTSDADDEAKSSIPNRRRKTEGLRHLLLPDQGGQVRRREHRLSSTDGRPRWRRGPSGGFGGLADQMMPKSQKSDRKADLG